MNESQTGSFSSNPPRTRHLSAEHRSVVAPTQDALYADIDLELSWSERDLPERERTKHVHRLHPYLGKFIPQLVEVLLGRYFVTGQHVLDPFAGSGTTLVQALESGLDATGADIAAFNCLLMEVKTRRYNPFVLERELRAACERIGETSTEPLRGYMRAWFAPQAARELLGFRGLVDDYVNADVLRVVLGRAARSARRTRHFDLDFPRQTQREEYWCHKHKRTCRPVGEAAPFLRRYGLDTLERIKAFSRVRARARQAVVLHGDARELEVGAGAAGTSRAALEAYSDGIVATLRNVRRSLRPDSPVVIVVNDRRELYPEILERAGLLEERRHRRHVNRRTGRRAGEYFEDVIVCRFTSGAKA